MKIVRKALAARLSAQIVYQCLPFWLARPWLQHATSEAPPFHLVHGVCFEEGVEYVE
jgi:hypothetical protein